MDKVTQLWIRACKSNKPQLRFQSILRRFYTVPPEYEGNLEMSIVIRLSVIVNEYCEVRARHLVEELKVYRDDEDLYGLYDHTKSFIGNLIGRMRGRILLTNRDTFNNKGVECNETFQRNVLW